MSRDGTLARIHVSQHYDRQVSFLGGHFGIISN